jgi:L-lysine 2,3-aminomutase
VPDIPQPRSSYEAITLRDLESLPHLAALPAELRLQIRAVASVLPFRVNRYILDELIDWSRVPDDPIYQLTFPQPDMLAKDDLHAVMDRLHGGSDAELDAAVRKVQRGMNPHPAGQISLNVPRLAGRPLRGVQHKYRETVLFFPSQGQTCHAYCTYCFRWPQFVGLDDLKFAARDADELVTYLRRHPMVTDVLITGGDPLIMRTTALRRTIEPLLTANLPGLSTIRIGTKSLAYWPRRFLLDSDADDLMRLFEDVTASGLQLALMAHSSHPRELATRSAATAIRRVRSSGAVLRCQAPLIRRVNDDPDIWAELWRMQVSLGAVPYYMFVERDTGPKEYFKVPLARAAAIFHDAQRQVSGLCRTARGPSMSATPGKVIVDGVLGEGAGRRFLLRMIQGRDPAWVGRAFLAEYDEQAAWLDELRPIDDEPEFFFERDLRAMQRR